MQKFFRNYRTDIDLQTQKCLTTNTYSKAPLLSSYEENETVSLMDTSISPPVRGSSKVENQVKPEIRETRGVVLLLCSNEEECAQLKPILESEQYTVRRADWNRLSISDFENVSIILALADATNPIVDSYCRKLRNSFPLSPIVFIDASQRYSEPQYSQQWQLEQKYSQQQLSEQQIAEHRQIVMQYAVEYIAKPYTRDSVLWALHHAMQIRRLKLEKMVLLQHLGHPIPQVSITGSSVAAQTLRRQIEAFGKLETTILITGDKGTGKNTIAQLVHQASARANQPFLLVPCDAFPPQVLEAELFGGMKNGLEETSRERVGKLKLLSEGTVLLDNVECLTPFLQRKLLAFLQNQSNRSSNMTQPDAPQGRIIASTCGQLPYVCAQRKFLEELFYLLRSMTISVPTLKERAEDIPELSGELVFRLARQFGINQPILSTTAQQKLRQHSWIGNIHELEKVLYEAMSKAKDEIITDSDITFEPLASSYGTIDPHSDSNIGLAGLTMSEIERLAIIETIVSCNGNRAQAAQKLGISEKTIYNKIKQFKLRGLI